MAAVIDIEEAKNRAATQEIEETLRAFWEGYRCQPESSYVSGAFCWEMAKHQPDRVLQQHHGCNAMTWAMIAHNCPVNCCIVLYNRDNDVTFDYMVCP